MQRRQFITLLGGGAAWPLAALAQQAGRLRRIGVLMNFAADDPEGEERLAAFLQGLQEAGWSVGRNAHVDVRWTAGEPVRFRKYAGELVALAPDAILASSSPSVAELQRATRTIPIVFVGVSDPVAQGFVESLAHPGGNITGFSLFEFAMSGKWLELLKQLVPDVTRVGVVRETANPNSVAQLAAIQAVAPALRVDIIPIGVRDATELEHSITAFARGPHSALIVTASPPTLAGRGLIIALAARYNLPAIYPFRFFVADGGLISYGANSVDPCRRAAGYVDRILKGEKPADLPVQAATKFELIINLNTAKALGLAVPPTLRAIATEVIE